MCRATKMLFPSKLAFARDSLVGFGGALNPVLELAVALGQPLGHDESASGRPMHVRRQGNSLANPELMVCHYTAFRF